MKKSEIEDLIWKIESAHTRFDFDSLVAELKKEGGAKSLLYGNNVGEPDFLRDLYETSLANGGFYFESMWESKILPEGAKECIFDYDIIYRELERQSKLEQNRVQGVLAKYMADFPVLPTYQKGFNFDECFIRFLNDDHFDMSIMFSNRLYWWYDLHRELFD